VARDLDLEYAARDVEGAGDVALLAVLVGLFRGDSRGRVAMV
jgi:hypothetical protein